MRNYGDVTRTITQGDFKAANANGVEQRRETLDRKKQEMVESKNMLKGQRDNFVLPPSLSPLSPPLCSFCGNPRILNWGTAHDSPNTAFVIINLGFKVVDLN